MESFLAEAVARPIRLSAPADSRAPRTRLGGHLRVGVSGRHWPRHNLGRRPDRIAAMVQVVAAVTTWGGHRHRQERPVGCYCFADPPGDLVPLTRSTSGTPMASGPPTGPPPSTPPAGGLCRLTPAAKPQSRQPASLTTSPPCLAHRSGAC